jgi:hypothetical protein
MVLGSGFSVKKTINEEKVSDFNPICRGMSNPRGSVSVIHER